MIDYTPRTLRMDRAGVDWIVEHALELRAGEWPGGIPSDYTTLPAVGRAKRRAPFELAVNTLLELELRVRHCGLDGLLVEERMRGKDEEEIARERFLDVEFVRRRINKVLWYCSSGSIPRWVDIWRKKKGKDELVRAGINYEDWKKRREYRGASTTAPTALARR